jgi:hypothetical protein
MKQALAFSILAASLLAGCATTGRPANGPAATGNPDAANTTVTSTGQADTDPRMAQAAVAPLNDLNLVRAPIPRVLAAAQKAPYASPADVSCAALAADIQALDAALGADLDTPPTAANPSLIERGTGAAGDAVVGAVRNTTEGVIPFRGWVRKLTGAERYGQEVAAAIAAGTVRRAYLKGLGQAGGCPAPASPRR